MKYVFYSVIGKHGKKDIEKILQDKQKEIENCPANFSLWAAKIDAKSIEQAWSLSEAEEVFVLGKISVNAKDPTKGKTIETAQHMTGPNGIECIPAGIKATYTKDKKYQAYVVKEYKILKDPIIFDFGKYESIMKFNEIKPFRTRFQEFQQFQNTFGRFRHLFE